MIWKDAALAVGIKDTVGIRAVEAIHWDETLPLDQEANPVAARACAFAAIEEDHPFSGKAMLMTIYANGVQPASPWFWMKRWRCGNNSMWI